MKWIISKLLTVNASVPSKLELPFRLILFYYKKIEYPWYLFMSRKIWSCKTVSCMHLLSQPAQYQKTLCLQSVKIPFAVIAILTALVAQSDSKIVYPMIILSNFILFLVIKNVCEILKHWSIAKHIMIDQPISNWKIYIYI